MEFNTKSDFIDMLAEELGIVDATNETFNSVEEVYKVLRDLHGTVTGNGTAPLKLIPKFEHLFDAINSDCYQCGDNEFCTVLYLYVAEEDKTHEFKYYTDGTDTIEDDEVFNGWLS